MPPSHALLCCGCRAAVPAQMQLSLVEDTLMRMRGDVGHSARQRVQETMLQVSAWISECAQSSQHLNMSQAAALVSCDAVLTGTPLSAFTGPADTTRPLA